jgi:hypothetical protein
MLLDAGFVVLEGFEGTLDEVLWRGTSPKLSADLAVLQTRINALRASIEPPEAENGQFCGERWSWCSQPANRRKRR